MINGWPLLLIQQTTRGEFMVDFEIMHSHHQSSWCFLGNSQEKSPARTHIRVSMSPHHNLETYKLALGLRFKRMFRGQDTSTSTTAPNRALLVSLVAPVTSAAPRGLLAVRGVLRAQRMTPMRCLGTWREGGGVWPQKPCQPAGNSLKIQMVAMIYEQIVGMKYKVAKTIPRSGLSLL